jgi:dTDP-glucose 4,6-dehydratase
MKNIKNILITGGAGFIGSNFIELILSTRNYNIINIDALTYAGNLENLTGLKEKYLNYKFIKVNILHKSTIKEILKINNIDTIINFAAESHVDRSIIDSSPFLDTNVKGTLNLLDLANELKIQRFIQISTDEVYGSLGTDGYFTENTPLNPNSPYSASKTSADMFAMAYHHTYETPVLITRCSNNYGPKQFPEKLIPLIISNCLENKQIPVYGDGLNVRDWIHVNDHNLAILDVLEKGETGQVYNIGSSNEKTNIEIVKTILNIMGKGDKLITHVKDRLGHDKRYAIDSSKIQNELGWIPKMNFENGIKQTIEWYLNNRNWIKNIKNGDYMSYYDKNYSNKFFTI